MNFVCDFGVSLIWVEYISSTCDPLLSTEWSPELRRPSVSVSSLCLTHHLEDTLEDDRGGAKLYLPGGPKWGQPRSSGGQLSPDTAATLGKLEGNAYPKAACHQALEKAGGCLAHSFPAGWHGKVSACNAGDPGFNPWVGKIPEEGTGSPLQYSCLENSMDRGAL